MDSPLSYARAVVALRRRDDRERRLAQVAPDFRALVAHNVAYMLAGVIADMPDRAVRGAALADVPVDLLDQVRTLVRMKFQARAWLRDFDAAREPGAVVQ